MQPVLEILYTIGYLYQRVLRVRASKKQVGLLHHEDPRNPVPFAVMGDVIRCMETAEQMY